MNTAFDWQSEPPRRAQANEVELAYWDTGEGVPLLVLHGFPTSRRLWRHQMTPWARAGYRVIAPDLPGFGDSARPPDVAAYRLERVAANLLALLDSLNIERCHVVGHDWGAGLSWWLCTSCPERVLRHVSLSVGHPAYLSAPSLEQRRRLWYALLFQFEGLAEKALMAHDWKLFREHLGGHAESEQWLSDLARPGALTAALNWYRANTHPADALWDRLRWGESRVPTLGVWSDRDEFLVEAFVASAERWMRADWRYERLAGASHWMALDAPDRVAGLVLDWLGR